MRIYQICTKSSREVQVDSGLKVRLTGDKINHLFFVVLLSAFGTSFFQLKY